MDIDNGIIGAGAGVVSLGASDVLPNANLETVAEFFWGRPDSNVDWCELNYAVSPYVAEFYNALSSLPIAVFGVFGMVMAVKCAYRDLRYLSSFLAVIAVGIGSFLFHATMRYHMQLLDELPMLWGSNVLTFIIARDIFGEKRFPWLASSLTAFALGLTAIYLLFPNLYAIFLLGYTAAVASATLLSIYRVQYLECPPLAAKTLKVSAAAYFGGFSLWVLENTCCHALPGWWKLHSIWHLSAGLGTYLWIEFSMLLRAYRLKHSATFNYSMLLPYVEVSASRDREGHLSRDKERETESARLL